MATGFKGHDHFLKVTAISWRLNRGGELRWIKRRLRAQIKIGATPHLRNDRLQNNELFLGRPTIDIAHAKKPCNERFYEFRGKRE
jgi:hypothetical protein